MCVTKTFTSNKFMVYISKNLQDKPMEDVSYTLTLSITRHQNCKRM